MQDEAQRRAQTPDRVTLNLGLFYTYGLTIQETMAASDPSRFCLATDRTIPRILRVLWLNRHRDRWIFRLGLESQVLGSCRGPSSRSTIERSGSGDERGGGPPERYETRMTSVRHVFGIEELDRDLGGGLIPGTLTVVAGATGVGKTQLGLHWANAGLSAEGRRGVLCDLTSRGDSQNHAAYCSRLFGWELQRIPPDTEP